MPHSRTAASFWSLSASGTSPQSPEKWRSRAAATTAGANWAAALAVATMLVGCMVHSSCRLAARFGLSPRTRKASEAGRPAGVPFRVTRRPPARRRRKNRASGGDSEKRRRRQNEPENQQDKKAGVPA